MAGAINQDGPVITMNADDDLSDEQWHIMEVSATGKVDVASDPDCSTANGLIGVLENKPSADGEEAQVRVGGVAKVMCGTTIAVGKRVTTDASGHAAIAVAHDNYIGIALTTGASGKLMEVLLCQGCEGFPDDTP